MTVDRLALVLVYAWAHRECSHYAEWYWLYEVQCHEAAEQAKAAA